MKELCVNINKKLEKLNEWSALSLNVSKTNFMRFGNRHSNAKIELRIGDKEIEEVFVFKFWGVLMDNKLNWKEHICMIKSKLAKSNAIIYRASKYLDTFSLKKLYCSPFMPYLSYCSEIWGETYITYINSLYLLQRKVVRTMSKVGRLNHTNALFVDLKLLKLSDLIELKIAKIVLKVKQKVLPQNIMNYFKMMKKDSYKTRHTRDLKQVYTRTTHKAMNISIYGAKIVESIGEKIEECVKVNNIQMYVQKPSNS